MFHCAGDFRSQGQVFDVSRIANLLESDACRCQICKQGDRVNFPEEGVLWVDSTLVHRRCFDILNPAMEQFVARIRKVVISKFNIEDKTFDAFRALAEGERPSTKDLEVSFRSRQMMGGACSAAVEAVKEVVKQQGGASFETFLDYASRRGGIVELKRLFDNQGATAAINYIESLPLPAGRL